MGKFWQVSTELRPLIDVRKRFSLSIIGIRLPIFLKFRLRDDIVMSVMGLQMGKY